LISSAKLHCNLLHIAQLSSGRLQQSLMALQGEDFEEIQREAPAADSYNETLQL
jgi:hypothetical protein